MVVCTLLMAVQLCVFAQDSSDSASATDGGEAAVSVTPESDDSERTALNLLGEVDSESGEGRRNENVQLTLIDNNVLKELNERMGTTATIVEEFRVEHGYFGAEFGGSPSSVIHVTDSGASGFHGNVFWTHNNSALSARSFFQVGDVQPARTNDYGVNTGFALWEGAYLSLDASQRRLRGQVNGNVLVPAADERTPLTTDPDDRAIVERILGAFGTELPNQGDRLLNTNSPQNIDNDRVGGTLDQTLADRDRLILNYGFTIQAVEAFQLVGGQNPDTTTRNHRARMTWNRTWSPTTITDFTAGFDRVGSLLVPEETSIGPSVLFSLELESLGPSGQIPIDRAENRYTAGGRSSFVRGDHTLTAGFEVTRRQINGSESSDHRGMISFRADFGRSMIENLLWGTPSVYILSVGNVHRGFRNTLMQFYAGDEWRATQRLTMNIGLRYVPVTRPVEVDGLSEIPYSSDWNNFAPRFGLAYRLPGRYGVLRANYGMHYGEIFPATFMQSRFNPPGNRIVSARAPKLSDPLRTVTGDDRAEILHLADDLQTPYAHLYNFSWEWTLGKDWTLEAGYAGSRSHMLLTMWWLNRAQPVDDPEQMVSETINDRRPDKRYYDFKHVHNGSRGYFDAAKIVLTVPRWKALSADVSYWFSKAIDLGTSYTNTASGRDGRRGRSPWEEDYHETMKALSRFDQPHAVLASVSYESPRLSDTPKWVRAMAGGWQFGAVMLWKAGTPFTVRSGSDGPGWGNVDGASSDRANLVNPSIIEHTLDHPDTSAAGLPREAFGTITPMERYGNLGRNTFRKDGVANMNVSLSRQWSLPRETSLLFSAESLNFTNHPQFAEPGRSLSTANFGLITNTLNDGRAFRFTMRFGW